MQCGMAACGHRVQGLCCPGAAVKAAWCVLLVQCVLPVCCLRLRELAQITIPAGLLSQADGESLKELLRKGPVSVALNWTDLMPKASKVSNRREMHRCGWQPGPCPVWLEICKHDEAPLGPGPAAASGVLRVPLHCGSASGAWFCRPPAVWLMHNHVCLPSAALLYCVAGRVGVLDQQQRRVRCPV